MLSSQPLHDEEGNSVSSVAQKLPRAGPQREALRTRGQFWTPDWVAQAMVGYVLRDGASEVFDPAVGAGAFFRAARALAHRVGGSLSLKGTEIDPAALAQARQMGVPDGDLAGVRVADFLLDPPDRPLTAIVANPPYVRHHRLSPDMKAWVKGFGASLTGRALDGRAGLHVYFLLRALQLLAPSGRLAFILPADVCEGVFADDLWRWVTARYRMEAIVTFAPNASPFPGVDTNPIIFFIQSARPRDELLWARCSQAGGSELRDWVLSGFREEASGSVRVERRSLAEALETGLSRLPQPQGPGGPVLGDFATVVRGIVTGANHFFFLTRDEASALGLPAELLVPAIGRTRDVPGSEVTQELMDGLRASGRATVLFCPNGRTKEELPEPVRAYLEEGEKAGLPQRAIMKARSPWYRMERRKVPPILFAYLGRRNARFIRNLAGVVPLTCFLCVYPRRDDTDFVAALWKVLSHPLTVANLPRVGKTYGSGCIKVEPRSLERLPLPPAIVVEAGLAREQRRRQLLLAL